MKQPKEYYAFISYKREDKQEAKRLQHALEYYRLPNHLRKENQSCQSVFLAWKQMRIEVVI